MLGAIDWARMAVPQEDGYDTDALSRSVAPEDPREGSGAAGTGSTLFGGRTRVVGREGTLSGPRFLPAPVDHPNLARAESILGCWPAMKRQCGALLREVYPFVDTNLTPAQWRYTLGSSSDGFRLPFGVVGVTVDCPFGLAQALVHELAHHKLRTFGVELVAAQRLVTNEPTELYESPIVRDRRRPMTAVVHAFYSFMHVTALDVAMHDHAADDETARAAAYLLARNVPRMEAGRRELSAHLRTDAEGALFFESIHRWSDVTLGRGRAILAERAFGRTRPDGSPGLLQGGAAAG